MLVIIAPDKFKGSLSASHAAQAISRGWKSFYPNDETVLMPVADGGEGTLDALHAACGGQWMRATVRGPLGEPVGAQWLLLPDGTAAIEMAQASGLHLIDKARSNVLRADTYGTGELVLDALNHGCRKLIIGIGGSATTDGGVGLMRALGAAFYGKGEEITAPGELDQLEMIDFSRFDKRIGESEVVAACDVQNPLCGETGAATVFGPQKGASPEDVLHLDGCLRRLSAVAATQMGLDRSADPGAGAAGGLGWALMQVCAAKMRPGADVVLDAAGFDEKLKHAGLVITGEGSLDAQTALGKAPVGVARRAARLGVPVAAIAGSLGEGYEAVYATGISCAAGIVPRPMPLEEAMARAGELIESAALRLARTLDAGASIGRGRSN